MDALAPDLPGARVLDLFAGTGALGLEALSRGAASVDFVEWGTAALHALKSNVTALKARDRTRIFKRDATLFAAGLGPDGYDLVLADPPYTSRLALLTTTLWLEEGFSRVFAVEHPTPLALPPGGTSIVLLSSAVTIYRRS